MPIPILMPALSPTMTEGNLARWLKKEGDAVAPGDVLAEIETDKATMEVEAVDEGTLGRILVQDGAEEVAVNTPIAVLLEEGEDESALKDFDPGSAGPKQATTGGGDGEAESGKNAEKAPEAKSEPKPEPKKDTSAKGEAQAASAKDEPAKAAPPAPTDGQGERIFASPLARRLAAQQGIDLTQVTGSGPHGRIVKADIEGFSGAPAAASPTSGTAPAQPVSAEGEAPYDLVKVTNMRKVIARRMTESKQQAPHFYVTVDVEIDTLLKARAALNERAKEGEYKLSVNDIVIKAAAVALMQVPKANAAWAEDGIRRYRRADVSVAVALEDGLVTPVIKGAESKGLRAISQEMRDLAKRARDGKLAPEEYQGGTFTISNLGMYGVKHFEAVINQPQGAILAVGAGEQRPVVKNGELAVATVMSLTLSVDHRAVDGAVGAEYLAALKALIEEPLGLLL